MYIINILCIYFKLNIHYHSNIWSKYDKKNHISFQQRRTKLIRSDSKLIYNVTKYLSHK